MNTIAKVEFNTMFHLNNYSTFNDSDFLNTSDGANTKNGNSLKMNILKKLCIISFVIDYIDVPEKVSYINKPFVAHLIRGLADDEVRELTVKETIEHHTSIGYVIASLNGSIDSDGAKINVYELYNQGRQSVEEYLDGLVIFYEDYKKKTV